MSNRTISVTAEINDYISDCSAEEPAILTKLRAETAALSDSDMQIGPQQGQFLALLVSVLGAKRVLEIGTFTGYSSLVMAMALPEDGLIVTCDINQKTTAIARRYWQAAGFSDRIQLRLGPGLDSLGGLIADGDAGTFDFAFIDADKINYEGYFERTMQLVTRGGLIAIDNVLWNGKVIDRSIDDANTIAIRAFNLARRNDDRITITMLPIGDGMTLARKR